MPPPRSTIKPDEHLKQELNPRSRFQSPSSILSSKDTSKSSFSRRPPSSLPPKKSTPDPPKVWPSQPNSHKAAAPPQQPEKKGFWSWRPFRSAAAAPPPETQHRFHVLYSLHVDSVENLPASLNGLRLIVHWNRKEEGLQTMPSRVFNGVAEFDETLRQRCTVIGVRSAHQPIRYEAKLFTLAVVALDADELELGKHHIDLSRLLPEDDEARQQSHSWTTSFELTGMARGSMLNVTFNYDLVHQETSEESDEVNQTTKESNPSIQSVANKFPSRQSKKVVEQGSDPQEAQNSLPVDSPGGQEGIYKDAKLIDDLGADLDDEVDLVAGEFLNMLDFGLNPGDGNSDGEPDSPRGRLLKQFERDSLFGDAFDSAFAGKQSKVRGVGELAQADGSGDGLEFDSIMEAAESELQKAAQTARSKSRAKELEDEETHTLMQKFGLSEKALLNSSPTPKSNPVMGPHLNAPHAHGLGKGLGSVLQLEDGSSLRVVNPSTVSKNKASGALAMQVSKPVVVPSAMGSSAVDIIRHMASFGTEALAKQAMSAMPLQDITGTVEEVATLAMSQEKHGNWNQNAAFSGGAPSMASKQSRGRYANPGKDGDYDDYVSLEDLAPLAMQNIESLAIDGLKVQSDMAEEEAPSYLDAAAWGMADDFKKRDSDAIRLSHDVAGMRFENLPIGESLPSDVKGKGPLSMALTLEEWSKLDAGELDDDAKLKDRSLALMAAHNGGLVPWRGNSRKGGNMGNTLMVAMLVQLRDPLQNFEPVGAPMMALIQAERIMLPPKPRFGKNVSMRGNSERDDDEVTAQKEEAPQFKLAGVHLSGLKALDEEASVDKKGVFQKKVWGTQKQLQSGSRWLTAQGMSKGTKPSLLKSKPASFPAQTKVKQGETLWSISARVNGSGHRWRELAALNPHIRNPDVIFANETIKTR